MGGSSEGGLTGLPRCNIEPPLEFPISRARSRISDRKPSTISRFKVSSSPYDRKLPDVE